MSLRLAAIPVCLVGFLLCFSSFSTAGTIGLNWDSSTGATGYRVCYGDSPGNYFSPPLYDGPQTQTVISTAALAHCTTWHFVVTAYNSAGESGYSDPVASWPRPEVTTVSPGSALQGSQFTMTISGGSIDPTIDALIDNPNVVLENQADLQSPCTGVELLVTVEPTAAGMRAAEIGEFTITVKNPNGLIGTETFEVLLNKARFDIATDVASSVGRLNDPDYRLLKALPFAQEGSPGYVADYDLDGNGWVDGTDVSFVASNFPGCWDGVESWKVEACPALDELQNMGVEE